MTGLVYQAFARTCHPATMSGFTTDEVDAELARRAKVQQDLEASRLKAEHEREKSGTPCLHCGLPKVHPWSQAVEHALCDDCLDTE